MSYSAEIKKFKDALVKSDIGHEITKVIWFGSTLKKKAHRDSDVDILIVTKDGKAIQEKIADILLDFQMNHRTPVEIVTSSVDELYPIIDPFLKNILQYGQEVYSMPEKDLKVTAASHYLSLTQEFYDAAEDSI